MAQALVLGGMIGNATGLNPDGLSLDLNFAVDKSFSKPSTLAAAETQVTSRKGPSPVFTRGSGATMVGSDGLIQYGPENLIIKSEELNSFGTVFGTSVSTLNTFISPDGTLTAEKLIESSNNEEHGIFQVQSTSGTCAFSAYIKQDGRRYALIRKDSTNSGFAVFDLILGQVTQVSNTTATIEDAGNGWWRCSVITAAIGTCVIKLSDVGTVISGNNSYLGNGTSGILIWGIQLERSIVTRKYIPTTTSAVYGPRFDYDPLTLVCKGLLIEESRTNLVFPSDALTTQSRTVTAVAHTLSFYGTGTITLSGVAVATVSGTGVYPTRTTLTFTPTAGSLILTITGSVIFAQLEVGSFSTSYIRTTTTAIVRSADFCSIAGSNFTGFWNQNEGTLFQTFEASPNTNTTYVSASNGNIAANSVHIDNDTGIMRAVYYSGSSAIATLGLGNIGTIGTVNKIATAYSVNDYSASRNGGTVVTDGLGALPANLSQMNIGADERSQTPTSYYSNKCIKSLRYYQKRLPNAKLQSLTV